MVDEWYLIVTRLKSKNGTAQPNAHLEQLPVRNYLLERMDVQ